MSIRSQAQFEKLRAIGRIVRLAPLITALAAAAAQNNRPDNQPFPPYRIMGNIYYVGTSDIASYLIATPAGHILIDSGYEDTPPIIRDGILKLGFKLHDVRILLNSQAHFDHVAGQA
jgi:metallo-beta-lactamase class B